MSIRLRQESSLNLRLEGSIGSFRVGSGVGGQQSLEVKYFLTHIGLNFSSGTDDAILSELCPVREMFDFKDLDFDEIMQRDIDDARVSSELIPYLLDERSRDLIKFFPPIVVVVLPIRDDRNKPLGLYPAITEETMDPTPETEHGMYFIRSGPVGQEVFQFEQPISNGVKLTHDLCRFRVNTHRCRLVIVDGQHRAMALLAIYRNLKDKWSDERRAPFKEYYAEWTPNYISRFRLEEINLPVILCTVPALDADYDGDFDLKKAARLIFLTLNKTARKVSNSRNILLDDNDLIAHFLRHCLSEVKKKDLRSPHAFRIWNVELDQFGDKMKLQSPVAITGVNHINYIIEHLLLDNGTIQGIAPRSGRFAARKDLGDCLERLDGRNLLGATVADSMRRDNFSLDAATMLTAPFESMYGRFVISAFEQFRPLDLHNRAALELQRRVEAHQDRQLKPVLFEGQGIGRVFEAHRANLKQKLKEGYFSTDVPEIEAAAKRLDAAAERIAAAEAEFYAGRAEGFVADVADKAKLKQDDGTLAPTLVSWVTKLYENVFTTVAFQSALICGFFGELEKANEELVKSGKPALDSEATFNEYLAQLNAAFKPESTAQVKRLMRVFSGDVSGDKAVDWKLLPSNQTFRNVVYRGEMQPDQWPKYKYLLLELWNPQDAVLSKTLADERSQCRTEVFAALFENNKIAYCSEHRKPEEKLTTREHERIFKQTIDAHAGLIKNLGAAALSDEAMRQATSAVARTTELTPEHVESWDEIPEAALQDDLNTSDGEE